MRICLVDDDFTQLEYYSVIFNKWASKNSITIDTCFYKSSEEVLFENGDSFPYDLIVLDIQMDKISGIELARRIRKVDQSVTIAFISAMADYVFEGYEVQAIRYILKPVEEFKLFELLDVVYHNLSKQSQYFILSTAGANRKIDHDNILYFESMDHYVILHLKDRNYEYKYNISELHLELKDTDFIKTHRSYIVNLKYIESITRVACILSNSKSIPLSRSLYKQVNSKFIEYHKERGI